VLTAPCEWDVVVDALWIGLATYNEAANLPLVLSELRQVVPHAHIVIVDDGSPDGTGEVADRWAATDCRIHVIHRECKQGYASAQVAAARMALAAGPAFFVSMDADLSHEPAAVPQLVSALAEADVAVGSRYVEGGGTPGWSWWRRWLSRWGNLAFGYMGGLRVQDASSGFRAYRADALSRLDLGSVDARGYALLPMVLRRCQEARLRVCEVPIVFREREYGASKLSWAILREQLWLLLRLMASRLRAHGGTKAQRTEPKGGRP